MTELIVKMEDNGQLTPVAELVRCKDCLKRGSYEDCPICGASERTIYDNWFCADGKAKDGDHDG